MSACADVELNAAAREDICRLLSACYYQPSVEFSEEGVFAILRRSVSIACPSLLPLAEQLELAFDNTDIDILLLDYTRLFLGPTHIHAKPYGSVWLEGEKALMGESTMAVQGLYREAGLAIDEAFRELPDHIAVELEFLYLLIHRENAALHEGDTSGREHIAALRARFLGEHLGRWIAPFTTTVREHAEYPFYRLLAELSAAFVSLEVRRTEADKAGARMGL